MCQSHYLLTSGDNYSNCDSPDYQIVIHSWKRSQGHGLKIVAELSIQYYQINVELFTIIDINIHIR
jgi:hypothetical protein